eukprot:TRINITY_DN3444_c0_g1_i1.p1 TRINITY_DN3444_c0_g1~~TRINITY_DN3444_c0_g1_i1.p1  ORF type:complete len:450 (+),score=76.50 TRINITY_DN3444_c0_g1_i1:77-1351(+)
MGDPLSSAVWEGDIPTLLKALDSSDAPVNHLDKQGNSLLHLAIYRKNLAAVKEILKHSMTDILLPNGMGWTPIQLAIASRDQNLVKEVYVKLQHRLYLEFIKRIPKISAALSNLPDFSFQLEWEVSSWVPLVDRIGLLPSDTYTVFKKGSNVRIDCTLIGFADSKLHRGNVSVLLFGTETGPYEAGAVYILHRDTGQYEKVVNALQFFTVKNLEAEVAELMQSDVLQTEQIDRSYTVKKAKTWSGSDKQSTVSGYDCDVYDVKDFCVTLHQRRHETQAPDPQSAASKSTITTTTSATTPVSYTAYYSSTASMNPLLFEGEKLQKVTKPFAASISVTSGFPLAITQLYELIEHMSPASKYLEAITDFFERHFPVGSFPVDLVIPIFPTVSFHAKINNYNTAAIADTAFNIPDTFREVNAAPYPKS